MNIEEAMTLGEYLFQVDAEHKIVELTKDHLTIKLKPEVIHSLKEETKKDEALSKAVSTLLEWAQSPSIPVAQIVDTKIESMPTPPGEPEKMVVTIKYNYPGGYRLFEIRHLRPDDAKKLNSELSELTRPKF